MAKIIIFLFFLAGAHTTLIPFEEFVSGKFAEVFTDIEITESLYLGKHEDLNIKS